MLDSAISKDQNKTKIKSAGIMNNNLLQELNISDGLLKLHDSKQNKELGFTRSERSENNLLGLLPDVVMSLQEQVDRSYLQYKRFKNAFEKNIYLRCLHDANERLFYALVSQNLTEMLPIIYTPTVGDVVQEYSNEFRKARGLYISYPDRYKIVEILKKNKKNLDVIVVSDSQGVLGIGDQGVGGIEIPVAKLMVYTLCAGISPDRHLPIVLDVGTDNQKLLDDPLYLGWRHKRVSGEDYYEMLDLFVNAIKEVYPEVFLHWEDFGRDNAIYNLNKYRNALPSFNDDIQGTAAVTCSALISASKKAALAFSKQKIVFYGAGSAALGIADMIVQIMMQEGLTKEQAKSRIWVLDSKGLLRSDRKDLNSYKQAYMRDKDYDKTDLHGVVSYVKPTTLIGCSTDSGSFTKEIINIMSEFNDRPIIFPLSNPTKLAEAVPVDILNWSDGRALVATGSPFEPVIYKNKKYIISQCNNALVFPGIGLGMILSRANFLSDEMLLAASFALSEYAKQHKDVPDDALLPQLELAPEVSEFIADHLIKQAVKEKVSNVGESFDFQRHYKDYKWIA